MSGYWASLSELPEREVLPGNFRTAVSGREMSINQIRWVHPTVLPEHTHPDAEQAMVLTAGRISFTVAGHETTLRTGDVVIIPRGVPHSGRSVEGEATFIEIFAPARVENLLGFLAGPTMPSPAPGKD
ncbi:cupin domain-containing protein [Kineosporia succinea]|uniref:Quercetin dioxygenase-like cupin family protein n=1 Tax=Kineosporia succinea TaxID=84632 RepID=A0ABT9PD05_9ACTN|nr:cupin domain-containing protein [Kineosporia succinea]MDP9830588.1 quercetin dioxygenase-like cupin family protein [Kineosporia succinea]